MCFSCCYFCLEIRSLAQKYYHNHENLNDNFNVQMTELHDENLTQRRQKTNEKLKKRSVLLFHRRYTKRVKLSHTLYVHVSVSYGRVLQY